MWLPILALFIGFMAVFLPQQHIIMKPEYTSYIGIALVAGIDSIVGAIRALAEGHFNDRVFVTGFFTNAVLAAGLLYLGNKLRIEHVAVAIMVALVFRIFNNFGFIRRFVFARMFEKKLSADNSFPEP